MNTDLTDRERLHPCVSVVKAASQDPSTRLRQKVAQNRKRRRHFSCCFFETHPVYPVILSKPVPESALSADVSSCPRGHPVLHTHTSESGPNRKRRRHFSRCSFETHPVHPVILSRPFLESALRADSAAAAMSDDPQDPVNRVNPVRVALLEFPGSSPLAHSSRTLIVHRVFLLSSAKVTSIHAE